MKVGQIVAACAEAVQGPDPMRAVRSLLESWRGDLAAIAQTLGYISGVGGNARQVFYRSPDLTLLKVAFPQARRTPPHDHGTWAVILLLGGAERNTLYRTDGGRLRKASEVLLEPGSILPMLADTAHVAECVGDRPAIGLHVYGGDILELPRRMWDPQTLAEHPLDWTLYERFAKLASAAPAAPQPV